MRKRYFELAESQQDAIQHWNNSQFELSDIVLALTDSGVIEGVYLYNMFRSADFLKAMNVFKFNFALAKEELGIHGEYVERAGDIFSEDFNPKRNNEVLKFSSEEMEKKGKEVYEAIFSEIKKIVKSALSKNKS